MSAPLQLRLLAAPIVGAIVVVGVWVAGGLISDDFKTSVALTTVWFLLAAGGCAAVAYRVRSLRVPVAVGYLATAAAVGGFLAWSTLHNRVVHERVAVGIPASHLPAAAPAQRARPVQLAAGAFLSGEHRTTGRAAIVRLRSGLVVLTITGLHTSPGPDLRVRLVPGAHDRGDAPGNQDLGALKGNIGDQQYDLPARANVAHATVVIWCRAFSATFGSANLARS